MVAVPVFEPTELVLLAIVGLAWFYITIRVKTTAASWYLVLAQSVLLLGIIATNVEAFYAPDIFNFIEHAAGIALASFLFAYALYKYQKELSPGRMK